MITLRYFASLREALDKSSEHLDILSPITVSEVWTLANADYPLEQTMLVAVNFEYVARDYIVCDGDEVAFFPPVTGG
jgi:molybdopterin synthase sulfur carrier subunit